MPPKTSGKAAKKSGKATKGDKKKRKGKRKAATATAKKATAAEKAGCPDWPWTTRPVLLRRPPPLRRVLNLLAK